MVAALFGCGALETSVNRSAIKDVDSNYLLNKYAEKIVGKFELFSSEDFKDYPEVQIYSSNLFATVGRLDKSQGYSFYLPEDNYILYLAPRGGGWQRLDFSVKGGETISYRVDKIGQQPSRVASVPNHVRILSSGSLYFYSQIEAHKKKLLLARQPNFEISYDEPRNGAITISLDIKKKPEIDRLYINGIDKSGLLAGERVAAIERVVDGDNKFVVKIVSKQGYESVKTVMVSVLSERQKMAIAERAQQEKTRIEREEFARKAEEERIAREGDGSPDDLLCKKYGLKPQSSGYAECRMRIDLAKTESKRQQEQYERAQAEHSRQIAAIEKEQERQRAMRQLELGLRMMGGQSIGSALNSVGTGMPIAPTPPVPTNQIITLPGGKVINCTTMIAVTNCF